MFDFTVLVCMYNSDIEKIIETLESIIFQKNVCFEIIVCDDNSKNNYFDEIKQFLDKHNFEAYKLISNEKNLGTVKNLYSGLIKSSGKYIKPIGVGDMLANEYALDNMYKFMSENNSLVSFCNMILFGDNNQDHLYKKISIPRNKNVYMTNNKKRIKENIIVYNDQISGASLFYKKDYFIDLLERLSDKVIYMEDLCQYLVLLDGNDISYLDEPLVKYEVGNGISTNKTKTNNSRMTTDKQNFMNYLFDEYEKDVYINRRKRLEQVTKKYNNKLMRFVLKFFYEPKWLYYRMMKF